MNSRRALMQLNAAVALFGLAGLFGKETAASPEMIVLGRTVFATLTFAVLMLTGLVDWPANAPRRLVRMSRASFVLAFHWISFFQSIQESTVAVALLSYTTFPVFITIFEPLIFGEPRRSIDAITAGLIIAGLAVLVPRFDRGDHATAGICWGVTSGLAFAALVLMNRGLVREFSPAVIAAGQNFFAALILLVLLPTYAQPLATHDWLLLLVLGVLFTAFAQLLFIKSLTGIRAQLASIVCALEAVYGVLFAWSILGETPSARSVAGGALILDAVVIGAIGQPRHAIRDPHRPGTA